MAINNRAVDAQQERATRSRSRLFAVRIWHEEVAGGGEYRGYVWDIVTGAFRGFREWPELVDFVIGRMDEDGRADRRGAEGETE